MESTCINLRDESALEIPVTLTLDSRIMQQALIDCYPNHEFYASRLASTLYEFSGIHMTVREFHYLFTEIVKEECQHEVDPDVANLIAMAQWNEVLGLVSDTHRCL